MEQKQQRFSIGYVMSAFVVLLMIQNYFATPHNGKIKMVNRFLVILRR